MCLQVFDVIEVEDFLVIHVVLCLIWKKPKEEDENLIRGFVFESLSGFVLVFCLIILFVLNTPF